MGQTGQIFHRIAPESLLHDAAEVVALTGRQQQRRIVIFQPLGKCLICRIVKLDTTDSGQAVLCHFALHGTGAEEYQQQQMHDHRQKQCPPEIPDFGGKFAVEF